MKPTHLEMLRFSLSHLVFSLLMRDTAVLPFFLSHDHVPQVFTFSHLLFFLVTIYSFCIFKLFIYHSQHGFVLVNNHTGMCTFKCTHRQLRSLILGRVFSFTVQHRASQISHLTFARLSNITPRLEPTLKQLTLLS